MIPLHPQPVPSRPDEMRWVVPDAVLTRTGPAATVPAPLAALIADGTLTRITVEPAAVVTRLGAGRSWAGVGPRVRTALHAALEEPGGWQPAVDDERSRDDARPADTALRGAARDLLTGPVGRHARSHGGTIELVGVHDGVVTVRLSGACHGCPAAWITLHQRLERALRRRCPHLREVRQAGSRGLGPGI